MNRVSSGGGGGGGGGGGMVDMMSEMQKKLAARRAKAENAGQDSEAPLPAPASIPPPADVKRPWERQNTPSPAQVNGSQSQSPKPARKRDPSLTGPEAVGPVNGGDLDGLKQEILTEMRREFQRMKVEIIEAIRQEVGHR